VERLLSNCRDEIDSTEDFISHMKKDYLLIGGRKRKNVNLEQFANKISNNLGTSLTQTLPSSNLTN
jgi:hypothetical protein